MRWIGLVVVASCSFSPAEAVVDGQGSGSGTTDAGSGSAMVADRDNDTIPDDQDNCPDVANKDQANEDGDSRGDACDLCPGIATANDLDGDSDGIGDACDPQPSVKDTVIAFTGFNDPAQLSEFASRGTGVSIADWTISNGQLHQIASASVSTPEQIVWTKYNVAGNVYVAGYARVDALDSGNDRRFLAVTGAYYENGAASDAFTCGFRAEDFDQPTYITAVHYNKPPTFDVQQEGTVPLGSMMAKPDGLLTLDVRANGNASDLACTASAGGQTVDQGIQVNGFTPAGYPGVRVLGMTASIDYLFVVELGTP
ncbi:MAG TPA: thrombospondin type 3 repeat-containing protein [Kofleriaceae bacterium]